MFSSILLNLYTDNTYEILGAQDYDGGPNPVSLAQRAIGQDQLQDCLANRIKAKKAIFRLDTCESGALIDGYLRSRVDQGSEAIVGRLHEATGRPVLTATASGQYAYEARGARHALFTGVSSRCASEWGTNGNGLIELSELVAYVQDVVPKLAAHAGGKGRSFTAVSTQVEVSQTPRFGSRGEDFALVKRLQ